MTNTAPSPKRWLVIAAFLAIYTIWGSTYLAIAIGIETLPPFLMASTRFLIAGGLMFALTWRNGTPLPSRLHWRSAFIVGGLLLLGGNGGVTWSEQYVPSGLAALIVALVPMWIVILDWLRPGGAKPTRMVVYGLAIGLIGMVILVGPGEFIGGSQIDWRGTLVLVGATLCWSLGSVYSTKAPTPQNPLQWTAIEMLAGGVALGIVSLIAGEYRDFQVRAVSLDSGLALLYLIIFGSIIGFTAYMWLWRVSTPSRVATYAYVNPIIAVLLGWLIRDEEINLRIILATLLIVSAVALIITYRRPSAPASKEDTPPTLKEDKPSFAPTQPPALDTRGAS